MGRGGRAGTRSVRAPRRVPTAAVLKSEPEGHESARHKAMHASASVVGAVLGVLIVAAPIYFVGVWMVSLIRPRPPVQATAARPTAPAPVQTTAARPTAS